MQNPAPNLTLMMFMSGSGPGLPYKMQPAAVSSGGLEEPIEQGWDSNPLSEPTGICLGSRRGLGAE